MSFVDRDGVMSLIENLLAYSWPEELGSIDVPFKLMAYEDAMELYGTDQPDLRIPYQVRTHAQFSAFPFCLPFCLLTSLDFFQIQNLTNIVGTSVLKEMIKFEHYKGKVYALVFPQKSASDPSIPNILTGLLFFSHLSESHVTGRLYEIRA